MSLLLKLLSAVIILSAVLTTPVGSAATLPLVVPGTGEVVEGNTGTAVLVQNVSLTAPSTVPVSVNWTTRVVGNAPASQADLIDYAAGSGVVTFAPGETSKTVSVVVYGDTTVEANEYVVFSFTKPVNAKMGGFWGLGFGQITNDDVAPSVKSLKVSGKNLVNESGAIAQLRGVNRPSLEFRCVAYSENPGWAGFMTDDDEVVGGRSPAYTDTVVSSLSTWDKAGSSEHSINTVRLPLNESCWLGTAPGPYSGEPYRAFVKSLVDKLTASGRYVILDLHWSSPGNTIAMSQDVGPNREHSLPFWGLVAEQYKTNPAVAFDLYNEPRIWCHTPACQGDYSQAVAYGWGCYLNGCTYTYKFEDFPQQPVGSTIDIVGTQELLNAIRNTGSKNVIFIEGLGWGNSMDNWMNYRPVDLTGQIAASIHTYTSSGANVRNVAYLDGSFASGGLSSSFPILIGEFGEWMCSGVSDGFTENTMSYADARGFSYTAWGWDKGENCDGPTLVTSNGLGTPSPYGLIVKNHLTGMVK